MVAVLLMTLVSDILMNAVTMKRIVIVSINLVFSLINVLIFISIILVTIMSIVNFCGVILLFTLLNDDHYCHYCYYSEQGPLSRAPQPQVFLPDA